MHPSLVLQTYSSLSLSRALFQSENQAAGFGISYHTYLISKDLKTANKTITARTKIQ